MRDSMGGGNEACKLLCLAIGTTHESFFTSDGGECFTSWCNISRSIGGSKGGSIGSIGSVGSIR